MTGLASRVSAISRSSAVVRGAVDVEHEVLALPDAGHPAVAQSAEGAEDGLPLRVGDLGLEDDVDDHTGHWCTPGLGDWRYSGYYLELRVRPARDG